MKQLAATRLPFPLVAAIAALLAAPTAMATTYYWDTDGSGTPGFGAASGTWGTSAFWGTDAAGSGATANTTLTTSDAANFGTTSAGLGAGSITVSGTVSANSITYGSASGAITLSGGTSITLGGTTPTITVNNTQDTISTPIVSTTLVKAGTGKLILSGGGTLSGALSFSTSGGTLEVSGGTLSASQIGDSSSVGTINVTGGALTTAGSVILGWNHAVSLNVSSGSVTAASIYHQDASAGVMTISGTASVTAANVYTTSAGGGTDGLTVNFDGGTLTSARMYANANSATTGVHTLNIYLNSGTLKASATGNLIDNPTGSNAANAFVNATVKSGGAFFNSNGFTATILRPLVHDSTLGATLDGGLTLNDTAATKGTLVLIAANTYTGGTTVTAGTLTVSGAGTLAGTTGLTVSSGAVFNYLPTTIGTTLTLGTGSTLNLADGSTLGLAWNTTTANMITALGAATVGTGAGVVLNMGTGFTSGTTYTILTAGSGLGTGTYTILNPTNYTAVVAKSATTVTVTPTTATALTSAFWTGGLSGSTKVWAASSGTTSNWVTAVGGGATALVPGAGADVTISATSVTTAPTATVLGAGMSIKTLTIADTTNGLGLNADGNTLTITPGVSTTGITMNSSVPASTIAAPVALGAAQTWTNNSANTLTVNGAVSGASSLTKAGTGTIMLSGTNTYSGTTTVSGGLINLGVAEIAGTSGPLGKPGTLANSIVLQGGGLQFSSSNNYDYTTSGRLQLADGSTGTIDTNGVNVTFANAIGVGSLKTGGLIKAGSGTLTLSGANTYTGATTVSGGVLKLNNASAIANSSSVSVASGATLQGIASGTYTNTAAVSLVGTGAAGPSNTGALNFNANTLTWNAPLTLGGTTTVSDYGGAFNGTLNGAIGGTGPLTISSQGGGGTTQIAVWTLNAQSNYSGNTIIQNNLGLKDATYKLGIANALPTTTSLQLYAGSNTNSGNQYVTLDLNGWNQTLAGLTDANAYAAVAGGTVGKRVINSSATLATLTINNSGADAYGVTTGTANGTILAGTLGGTDANGIAANNLALTKTGAGTLTLAGTNTYTGTTTISGGTLKLGTGGSLAAATSVSIAAAATFDVTVPTAASATYTWNTASLGAGGTACAATLAGTAGGTIAMGSKPITLTYDGAHPALTVTGATLSLNNNPITVNRASVLADGDYTIVAAANAITDLSTTYPTPTGTALTGKTASITVSGSDVVLHVSSGGYAAWSGGAAFDVDSNGDGVKNGLAWLLGAPDKDANANALLPVPADNSGKLVMTFDCLSTANRGSAVLNLQFSNDLGISDLWSSHEVAVPGAVGTSTVGGVTFTATANGSLIHVVAEVPASAASPGTKLFGRLHANQP